MTPPLPTFYFDAVDPLSFLVDREIRAVERESGTRVNRVPFELRPAPAELTDADDPFWSARWSDAEAAVDAEPELIANGSLLVPDLIPRSRKAHELFFHAKASGLGDESLERIFEAFLLNGLDIGRVDVLVEIGRGLGLDHTETKAVLDVDRYEAEAGSVMDAARAAGIQVLPCLSTSQARMEGFHNQAAIGTLIAGR